MGIGNICNYMLRAKSLKHIYTNGFSLSFKDWEIEQGDSWLLSGDSGSGKTTLLHILTGILKPTEGELIIKDTPVLKLSSRELDKFRGQNIGIIFQRPHLIKSLNIKENLQLAQSFAGLPVDNKRIDAVLDSLNILSKKNNYTDEMSQGQLQRVSIARAVINKPALLFADEPTSSLDDKNATAVIDLLKEQSSINGSTLIVATHDKRVKDVFNKIYNII